MISLSSIAKLQKLEDKEGSRPRDILILNLQKAFEDQLPGGAKITRLIFVEAGIFKYVLHVGTLNAFIVKNQIVEDTSGPGQKTFADMLADEETLRQISKLVVFVPVGATLADAKAALDKVNGAQDIIVTGSGNATEPMLGWLSNVDLTKAVDVS